MTLSQKIGIPTATTSAAVKSVQRGTFGGAGSVTINSVKTAKTIVLSVSKAASGTAQSTNTVRFYYNSNTNPSQNSSGVSNNVTIAGGSTDIFTGQYTAVLTNATTVTADGACEYQVIEYY